MLFIAICDDNAADRTKLHETIENYLGKQDIEAKLCTYDNPDKLISAIESTTMCFDIIFLDIIMDDMNGMTCAKIIRQRDRLSGKTDKYKTIRQSYGKGNSPDRRYK